MTFALLHRLALLGSLPVVGILGYAIATHGPLTAGAAVAVLGCSAAFVVGLNRLHLAVLPLLLIAPLIGYLNVRSPGAGFSAITDVLIVLPLAVLATRAVMPGRAVDFLGGRQWLIWLFVVVAVVQSLDVANLGITINGARQTVLPMLLFFTGFHLDMSAPGRLRRCAWALVLSGGIPLIWALKQHFVGLDAAEEAYAKQIGTFWVEDQVRVFSTFRTPWELAVFAGGVALVACALIFAARRAVHKLFAVIVCILGTAALLVTQVRGCLLGYFIGLLFLAAGVVGTRMGGRRAWIVFGMLFAGYLAFAVFVGPEMLYTSAADDPIVRRSLTIFAPTEENAIRVRLEAWNDLWAIVAEQPFGIGLGSTGGVSKRFDADLPRGAIHADNAYLGMMLETGWAGGVLFLAIVLLVLISSVRCCLSAARDEDIWVRRSGAAYLIMMAVANVAAPLGGHIYWLVSGVMAADAYRERLWRAPSGTRTVGGK